MEFFVRYRKWIALVVVFSFLYVVEISSLPLRAEGNAGTGKTEASKSSDEPGAIERDAAEGPKLAKKRFPWFLVGACLLAAGIAVYFLVIKKPKYDLTVERELGIWGSPVSGITRYKKGSVVSYSYTLDPDTQYMYKDLRVTINGTAAAQSGTITINGDTLLRVEPILKDKRTLSVIRGEGVIGTPHAGDWGYFENDIVTYNYSLAAGYNGLFVTLDDVAVPSTGAFIMDKNRTLKALASKDQWYTLTVSGFNVNYIAGYPVNGVYWYRKGTVVDLYYHCIVAPPVVSVLVIYIDGQIVFQSRPTYSGKVTMNRDHTVSFYYQ